MTLLPAEAPSPISLSSIRLASLLCPMPTQIDIYFCAKPSALDVDTTPFLSAAAAFFTTWILKVFFAWPEGGYLLLAINSISST